MSPRVCAFLLLALAAVCYAEETQTSGRKLFVYAFEDSVRAFCTSEKNGWYDDEDKQMDRIKETKCGWSVNSARPAVCYVVWGKEEGGYEALELSVETAAACLGCTAGCGTCAGEELYQGLAREVTAQFTSIRNGVASQRLGQEIQAGTVESFTYFMAERIRGFLEGQVARGWAGGCIPGMSGFEGGVSVNKVTYGEESCDCGDCVRSRNAMRPCVAWYVSANPSCV